MKAVGLALIGVGVVALVVARECEKFHSRAFRDHTTRLQAVAYDDDKIGEEVDRFHNDKAVDWAIEVMFWGHVGGITALFGGVFLLVAH